MNSEQIIEKVADFVKVKQHGETTGHDWWYTYRVWQTAKQMVQERHEYMEEFVGKFLKEWEGK